VERIVELELRRLLARTQRLGYKVEISAEAKRRLAVMGYEARYGVRSLKRTLLDNVEEPLSTLIIEGRVNEGAKVPKDQARRKAAGGDVKKRPETRKHFGAYTSSAGGVMPL